MTNVHRCADYDDCYHPKTGELELIDMVSRGMLNKQIAQQQHRSATTIKNRLYELCTALGVHNRSALIRRAIELGLLTIEKNA